MVEFVSYTGKYPNLCRGVLTLCIDGEEVRFGHDYFESWETDGNYDAFWVTGGGYGFWNGWQESYTEHGEWQMIESNLPTKYRKYSEDIINIFNDNVSWGCCGGCL